MIEAGQGAIDVAGDVLGVEARLAEAGFVCPAGGALSGGAAEINTLPTVNPALCRVMLTLPRGCPMKLGMTNPSGEGV